MGELSPKIVADLVAHHRYIAAEAVAVLQQLGRAGQRRQPLEVDTMKGLVE